MGGIMLDPANRAAFCVVFAYFYWIEWLVMMDSV